MRTWISLLCLCALTLVDAAAANIVCNQHQAAIDAGLDLLRAELTKPPFSAFDYYIGSAAAANTPPLDKPEQLGREGFELRPFVVQGKPCIAVLSPTTVGLGLGVQRLVRIGLATPEQFGRQTVRMAPAMPIREMYEEQGWDNPEALDRFKAKLRGYLREGYNCVDIPFGWFVPPPSDVTDAKAYEAYWAPRIATVRAVIDYAHALGIQCYLVENPQFNPYFDKKFSSQIKPECLQPPMSQRLAVGGVDDLLLCPSRTDNMEAQRRARAWIYRALPTMDGIVVYFNDPGGCLCSQCADWGKTIVRVCQDFYTPLLRELAPHYKLRLTLWGTPRKDSQTVADTFSNGGVPVINDIQFPPTSPAPPYLVTDDAMLTAIQTAGPHRPIILQQFFDGVGFKFGWVNMVEHPMPKLMEKNLRESLKRSRLVGTYGSAFESDYQQVDTRLMGEWGWNPQRTAEDILIEMGNERLGSGAGRDFARGVLALEDYWDLACVQFFSDGDPENREGATHAADQSVQAFSAAAKRATRNNDFFTGLRTLATAAQLTNRQQGLRQQALEQVAREQPAQALESLNAARKDAVEIRRLMSTGSFQYMTKLGWWGADWVIGRRPELIDTEMLMADPARWEPVVIPNPDFKRGGWDGGASGPGKVTFSTTPQGPLVSLDNTAPKVEWSLAASTPNPVTAPTTYRLDFEARWIKPSSAPNALVLQWVEAAGTVEAPRVFARVLADQQWHRVTLSSVTPTLKAGSACRLRVLLLGEGAHAELRNLKLSKAKP